jgi:hypothetical protein
MVGHLAPAWIGELPFGSHPKDKTVETAFEMLQLHAEMRGLEVSNNH